MAAFRHTLLRLFAGLSLSGCIVFPPTLTVPDGGAIYTNLCQWGVDRDWGRPLFRGTVITLQPGQGGETLDYREEDEGLFDSATASDVTIDRPAARLRFLLPAREVGLGSADVIGNSDATRIEGEITPGGIVLTMIDGRTVHRALPRQTVTKKAIPTCPG